MPRLRALVILAMAWTVAACDDSKETAPSKPLPNGPAGGAGGDGGAGAAAGSGGMGFGGFGGECDPNPSPFPAPVLARKGEPGALLLQGMIVTPADAFAGEVLIVGDTITCVAPSCSDEPLAATASIVDTKGIVLPGLVDSHNHILYDIFDEADWTPSRPYTNHNQWGDEPRYSALVDAKQYLNGESGSPKDLGCELDKYGELKGLVAGTTSIQGSASPGNKGCYGSLARTVDQTPNGLGNDAIQTATLFPSTSAADGVCGNFTSGDTHAYVIHIAEGVDETARSEFDDLGTVSTVPGCLYDPKTTVIHGAALGDPELSIMATHGMSLVWSPRSNVFLYGAGTDLSRTANVPLAIMKGINVALAPDWSIGGSGNLLDELRFAKQVDSAMWGGSLSAQELTAMVTINAAKALGLGGVIGSLEPGKKADVMVIGGDTAAPYDALLAATPADVQLVLVGGAPLYGAPELVGLAPGDPGCEPVNICCRGKFLCVAVAGGDPTDKLGQTFGEITSNLGDAMTEYDALDLSAWDFAPIAPIATCR